LRCSIRINGLGRISRRRRRTLGLCCCFVRILRLLQGNGFRCLERARTGQPRIRCPRTGSNRDYVAGRHCRSVHGGRHRRLPVLRSVIRVNSLGRICRRRRRTLGLCCCLVRILRLMPRKGFRCLERALLEQPRIRGPRTGTTRDCAAGRDYHSMHGGCLRRLPVLRSVIRVNGLGRIRRRRILGLCCCLVRILRLQQGKRFCWLERARME
jgi:hypothetical protein